MSYLLGMVFSPDRFFDLAKFSHAKLFDGIENVWQALEALESYFSSLSLGTIEGEVSEKVYLINPELISIGQGSIVEPGAYISGPCVIGKNCQVRHAAYIRGGVILGDGAVIGHATEVKNSILLDEAKAAHFAYLGDTILGVGVNLGAGVKCANLRFDRKPIHGCNKLGLIAGDGAQLGCNAVTNPGTFLEKGAIVMPGSVV